MFDQQHNPWQGKRQTDSPEREVVDAIELLLREMVHLPWVDTFDWQHCWNACGLKYGGEVIRSELNKHTFPGQAALSAFTRGMILPNWICRQSARFWNTSH